MIIEPTTVCLHCKYNLKHMCVYLFVCLCLLFSCLCVSVCMFVCVSVHMWVRPIVCTNIGSMQSTSVFWLFCVCSRAFLLGFCRPVGKHAGIRLRFNGVSLPFRFGWLHLMFPVASILVPPPLPPPPPHPLPPEYFRSGCQSSPLHFKG